jgi:hypothetical protein
MFRGSDRLLGPTQPHFQWVPLEGEFPRRQNGRDVRLTTHPPLPRLRMSGCIPPLVYVYIYIYRYRYIYIYIYIYAFMTCWENTWFCTKHVEDRNSFVHKPAGFIFLSRRYDRFINCIAVIPRVSRRSDLDDIWTNPGLCFHMDLWKSLSTFRMELV